MPNSSRVESDSGRKSASEAHLIEIFLRSCFWGFPLIAAAVILGFSVPFFSHNLPEKVLVAKLTHASMGLLFGVFELLLGVLLALIGVSTAYDFDATVGPAKVKLISASPGILLILAANALIAFCLMRPFEASQAFVASPYDLPSSASTSGPPLSIKEKPKPLGVEGP